MTSHELLVRRRMGYSGWWVERQLGYPLMWGPYSTRWGARRAARRLLKAANAPVETVR